VGEPKVYGQTEYYPVTGSPATLELLLRKDAEGRIYSYDVKAKEERLYLDLTQDRAASTVDPCSVESAVESRAAKLEAPIGSFDNAVKVKYLGYKCADAGIDSDYFLPWVGLVRRVANTIAGPVNYDLVYAKLGTVTVITAPETGFSVAVSPLANRKEGGAMTARLTLRHSGATPLKLEYASGQEFELVVYNSDGKAVYRWSDGQLFTQAARSEKFAGERNWVVSLPWKELPAGRYVAQGWLVTADGTQWGAMTGFDIP